MISACRHPRFPEATGVGARRFKVICYRFLGFRPHVALEPVEGRAPSRPCLLHSAVGFPRSALRLLTNNQERITAAATARPHLTKLFRDTCRNSLCSSFALTTIVPSSSSQPSHFPITNNRLTKHRVTTHKMTTKSDPYATKMHKRVDALLFVLILLLIAFFLRTSARGEAILSVAPQPFWSTLNLFKPEPKLSLVLVAPSYLTPGAA